MLERLQAYGHQNERWQACGQLCENVRRLKWRVINQIVNAKTVTAVATATANENKRSHIGKMERKIQEKY